MSDKVIDFPTKAEVVAPAQAVPQDEKIIIFQIISPNQCVFLCLSVNTDNNKFDIGIVKR